LPFDAVVEVKDAVEATLDVVWLVVGKVGFGLVLVEDVVLPDLLCFSIGLEEGCCLWCAALCDVDAAAVDVDVPDEPDRCAPTVLAIFLLLCVRVDALDALEVRDVLLVDGALVIVDVVMFDFVVVGIVVIGCFPDVRSSSLTALAGASTPQSFLHLKYRTPPTAPSFSPFSVSS